MGEIAMPKRPGAGRGAPPAASPDPTLKRGRTGGYYLMHRGWQAHEIFADEPFSKRDAWVWMIEHALWQPRQFNIGGQLIKLRRGEFCTSIRAMAEAWRWSKSVVQRFLNAIQKRDMISLKSGTGRGRARSVITICNYERYQIVPSADDAGSGTADGDELGHNWDTTGTEKNTERRKDRERDAAQAPPPAEDGAHRIGGEFPATAEARRERRPSAAATPPDCAAGAMPDDGDLRDRCLRLLAGAGRSRLDGGRLLARWLSDLTERLGDEAVAMRRLSEMVERAAEAGDPVAYLSAAIEREPTTGHKRKRRQPASAPRPSSLGALDAFAPSAEQLAEIRSKFPQSFSRWKFELGAMKDNEKVRAAFAQGERSEPWLTFREWMRREERGEIKHAVNGSGARMHGDKPSHAPQAG